MKGVWYPPRVPRVRGQQLGTGNRCGHRPKAWRCELARPKKEKRPPLVFQLAARKLGPMMRAHLFPELHRRQLNLLSKAERERRSELLEAIVLVCLALLVRCDLLTLRIRWRGLGLPLSEICRWTGLGRRRVQRALRELRFAGYLRGPGEDGPGIIRQPIQRGTPLPAIREFTVEFFDRLGLADELREARDAREALLVLPLPPRVAPIDYLAPRADRCSVIRAPHAHAIAARRARAPDSG